MKPIKIKEDPNHFYYKFNNSVVALTKAESDKVENCRVKFIHLEDVPNHFKVNCCIMQFDQTENEYTCSECCSSFKQQEVCINKLEYVYIKNDTVDEYMII